MKDDKKRIILVDDEEQVLKGLKIILRKSGYDVRIATNGFEALELQNEDPVGIIITDILMPGMDGIELISKLKSNYPDIKIIAMSGGGRVSSTDYLEIAKKLNVSAVLNKPFSLEDILIVLEKI